MEVTPRPVLFLRSGNSLHSFFLFPNLFILDLDRGDGNGKERERNIKCVVASGAPPTGDLMWPTTLACALTGNRTGNPLVRRPVLNPLSSQGETTYALDGQVSNFGTT